MEYMMSVRYDYFAEHPGEVQTDITINPDLMMKYNDEPLQFLSLQRKPWDCDGISRNPIVTVESVEKNPEKPWDWSDFSRDPNPTMKYIERMSKTIKLQKCVVRKEKKIVGKKQKMVGKK
jgi:hypothetical protein